MGWMTPNLSNFEGIQGDVGTLIRYLIVAWTTAGIGEEIIWRGFLMVKFPNYLKMKRKA